MPLQGVATGSPCSRRSGQACPPQAHGAVWRSFSESWRKACQRRRSLVAARSCQCPWSSRRASNRRFASAGLRSLASAPPSSGHRLAYRPLCPQRRVGTCRLILKRKALRAPCHRLVGPGPVYEGRSVQMRRRSHQRGFGADRSAVPTALAPCSLQQALGANCGRIAARPFLKPRVAARFASIRSFSPKALHTSGQSC